MPSVENPVVRGPAWLIHADRRHSATARVRGTANGQRVVFRRQADDLVTETSTLSCITQRSVGSSGGRRAEGGAADATLRAATFGYVTGNVAGPSTIDVDIVRRGRSMIAIHARVTQNGAVTTVGRFHHSAPRQGPEYSDVDPAPARPVDAERLQPLSPAHFRNVEAHLDPATSMFSGTGRAEWRAWCRPLDTDIFDASWLTMFGDYFPPAVFAKAAEPSPALTIEYGIQIHDAAASWTLGPDEFLAAHVHAFHSHDGFAVEDGTIHLPDGRLLATVRQTRLAG